MRETPESHRKTLTRPQNSTKQEFRQTECALSRGNIAAAKWSLRRALRSITRNNMERAKAQIITALEALETNE